MSEWISVKDRLPQGEPVSEICVVFAPPSVSPRLAFYAPQFSQWFRWDNEPIENVTHWMPLPDPPTPDTSSVLDTQEEK